jgi:RNA polymerase sigma factor (sigma-70 family)
MNPGELNINNEILDRCKNGDPKAQFILYRQYSKAMYNIAMRFLNNQMDAEDILQESFVTAFEKLNELTNDSAFGSWLKRIVINNCISHIRRRKIYFADIEDYAPELLLSDDDDDLSIDPVIVHSAIKELPAGGRTILALHVLEGYKHQEIADMLGISESTSKSQYKRALDILFRNLKHNIYVS